jgi:hypothetical protein
MCLKRFGDLLTRQRVFVPNLLIYKEYIVKSKLFKISAAVGLLTASVVAMAANACCGNLAACCLEMLACCF